MDGPDLDANRIVLVDPLPTKRKPLEQPFKRDLRVLKTDGTIAVTSNTCKDHRARPNDKFALLCMVHDVTRYWVWH